MKVLFIYTRFFPRLGGVQTYILNVSKEMKKLGHEVAVVCSDEGDKLKRKEIIQGVQVYRYKMPKLDPEKLWRWPIEHNNAAKKLITDEGLSDCNVAISRAALYVEGLIEVFGKDKVIYIAPNFLDKYDQLIKPSKERKKSKAVLEKMEKKAISNLDKIITLSEMVKRQVSEINPNKNIRVIKPGLDFEKFKISELKEKNAIYVGRLSEEKNVIGLLRAFKKIKSGKLIVVGGGPEEEMLKRFAKDNGLDQKIKFVGWRDDPENFLKKASVFILPSIYESFGHVFLEAMASGLPIIAFKPNDKTIITAADEIVKDGKTGFLVENEKGMGEKIEELLEDEKLRKKIGREARNEVEKYSWKKTAKEILNFVKS